MYMHFRIARQIVVKHCIKVIDIQTTSRNIGRDQNRNTLIGKLH
ncbi:Uncharacterised protein [Vibrio cholerae]|nr:Uncharacterised protein [Vibrio cholerae]